MKPGDLVQFIWPDESMEGVQDFSPYFIDAKVGLVLKVFKRTDDTRYGDEILVYHDNTKWSVPETWCKRVE
jgi:hypothetical protein